MILSAVSPDSSILAVYNASSSSRILIQCYDAKVALGSFKFTLSADAPHEKTTIDRILFATSQYLVASSTKEDYILVFDLHRGVLCDTIYITSHQARLASIATMGDCVYALCYKDGKTMVIMFDLSKSAKVVGKVKTGNCDQEEPLAIDVTQVPDETRIMAVRLGKKVKLVNCVSGSTICKVKVKDSDSDSAELAFVRFSPDGKCLVVNTRNKLHFFSIDIKDKEHSHSRIGTSALTNINDLCICMDKKPGDYIVSATDNATVSLLSVHASNEKKTSIHPFAFLSLPETKENCFLNTFFVNEDMIMMELSKKGIQNNMAHLARLSWKNESGNLYPNTNEKDESDERENEAPSKKRKTTSSNNCVIGPGESGGEALTVTDATKKMKRENSEVDNDEDDFVLDDVDDEEGEHTIAQKLALLSSALDRDDDDDDLIKFPRNSISNDNRFKAKTATADSLLVLLRQALLANDDAQLEIALQVSDKKVIERSIIALRHDEETNSSDESGVSKDMTIILLTKLVTRISRKPSRAQQLSFWVRTVLMALISPSSNGSMKIGKREKEIAEKLAPLRNMLSERVESLPELMRLEGRLGLIGS
mmetsp:Transcript_12657/g.23725  ORF Transcript_12657/g.23725 Transcript_12657/m.23725 type:complete len:593 (+) Transcript_12657:169-1947(+)